MSATTIAVTSLSHTIPFPVPQWRDPDAPSLPLALATVSINGTTVPTKIIISPSHFTLVVFDPTQPPSAPGAVLFSKALWNPTNDFEEDLWWSTNDQAWDYIHNQILAAGNPTDLLFLLATGGFDVGMVPSPAFATFLFGCGAGSPLQSWIAHAPGGSGASPQKAWVATPANYIFMGGTGLGYGKAIGEKFEVAAPGQTKLTTTLTLTM